MVKMSVLEEIVRRNSDVMERVLKNTHGVVVSNNEFGIAVYTTFDNTTSAGIIKLINGLLCSAARSAIRDIDTTNDLIYLRVGTRKFEYLIGPEEEFSIVVVQ